MLTSKPLCCLSSDKGIGSWALPCGTFNKSKNVFKKYHKVQKGSIYCDIDGDIEKTPILKIKSVGDMVKLFVVLQNSMIFMEIVSGTVFWYQFFWKYN